MKSLFKKTISHLLALAFVIVISSGFNEVSPETSNPDEFNPHAKKELASLSDSVNEEDEAGGKICVTVIYNDGSRRDIGCFDRIIIIFK